MEKFLLVTDLDHTLVGDRIALQELNRHLTYHRQAYGTQLAYSTGRSLTSYQQLAQEQKLLTPDALITAVGTEIYHPGNGQNGDDPNGNSIPDPTWSEKLAQQWKREQVVATAAHFADLVPQADTEQRPFKVSYFLTEEAATAVIPQLSALLTERQLAVKLIYSSGRDFDILPHLAGKGAAMVFLRQKLGFAPERTVVCGDSGNDEALFSMGEERGIIVGNAQPELRRWHQEHAQPHHYLAQGHCANGILEGLKHFGFLEK